MDIDSFIKTTKERIALKSALNHENECIKWSGITTGGRVQYGKIKVKFPSDTKTKYYYCHRVIYRLNNKLEPIPLNIHISHLCGFSLCVNPAHLSAEPAHINNCRKKLPFRKVVRWPLFKWLTLSTLYMLMGLLLMSISSKLFYIYTFYMLITHNVTRHENNGPNAVLF